MDTAREHELTMREWKEQHAGLPETELSAPAESLIAQERALWDTELSGSPSTE